MYKLEIKRTRYTTANIENVKYTILIGRLM